MCPDEKTRILSVIQETTPHTARAGMRRQFQLTQVWCEVQTRDEYALAVSDGQPVRIWELDEDLNHYLTVPTVQAILIPMWDRPESRQVWATDYCEICRRVRAFRPLDGYDQFGHGLPEVP